MRAWWILLVLLAPAAHGHTFPLPPEDVDLVGQVRVIEAAHEDTLLDIARR